MEVSAYGYRSADIQKAMATLKGEAGTLYFSGATWVIDADLTIPGHVSLRVENGARISLFKGVTLQIKGPLEDCLYQIFNDDNRDVTKGIKFNLGAVAFIRPEWWGAKGDGNKANASTNSNAIEKALFSRFTKAGQCTTVVRFALGTYYIKQTIVLPLGTYLVGQGKARGLRNGTVITLDDRANCHMIEDSALGKPLRGAGMRGGCISGISFNGGQQTAAFDAIHFTHDTRLWQIKDCFFIYIKGYALYFNGIGRSFIENNIIEGCQNGMYLYIFDSWINNNEISASDYAVRMAGCSGSTFKGNIINGGKGCNIGLYIQNNNDTSIIGNRIDNFNYGIKIYNAGGLIIGNAIENNFIHGIYANPAINHCIIANNLIANNGRGPEAGYGISIDRSCEGGQIVGNVFRKNARGPINFAAALANPSTQDYTLIENNSGVDLQCEFPVLDMTATTSPRVGMAKRWKTNNQMPQKIIDFSQGCNGKEIIIVFGDSNTTIKFSGNAKLKGHGGVDWHPVAGDHLRAVKMGGTWYCECFSNTPSKP